MTLRPPPAELLRAALGGTAESPTFLAHTEHGIKVLTKSKQFHVLSRHRCTCGGLLAVVVAHRDGDLLVSSLQDQDGDMAAQVVYLDEVGPRMPAARCHCGNNLGNARSLLDRVRSEATEARSARRHSDELIYGSARRVARPPLTA